MLKIDTRVPKLIEPFYMNYSICSGYLVLTYDVYSRGVVFLL